MYVYIIRVPKVRQNWEYGRTETGSVTNNAIIAPSAHGDKIRYAGKTTCTRLEKRVLPMSYPQSPAALAANVSCRIGKDAGRAKEATGWKWSNRVFAMMQNIKI
jgi:hypothetical protein